MSLESKNVMVTGGSRDVGAAITAEFLKEGANVGICHYHSSQSARAESNYRFIPLGVSTGKAQAYSIVLADLTSQVDRSTIFESWEKSFDNKLDFLVLNASGSSNEINVVANNALVDRFMELRGLSQSQDRAIIVLMQSVPGHFYDRLGASGKISPFYLPIARSKFNGERSLLKRIPEFDEANVSFMIVCPPIVPDTTNMRLFNRKDRQMEAKHRELTGLIGLPDEVFSAQVGQKVVELVMAPPKQGHVEFFNDTQDGKNALSSVYGPSLRLIDTYNIPERTTWMIVRKKLCRDHFLGNPILPGFLIEEAAAQAAALIACDGSFEQNLPILKSRKVDDFRSAALPGHFLRFELKDFDRPRNREFIGNIAVTNQDGIAVTSDVYIKGRILPRKVAERIFR